MGLSSVSKKTTMYPVASDMMVSIEDSKVVLLILPLLCDVELGRHGAMTSDAKSIHYGFDTNKYKRRTRTVLSMENHHGEGSGYLTRPILERTNYVSRQLKPAGVPNNETRRLIPKR